MPRKKTRRRTTRRRSSSTRRRSTAKKRRSSPRRRRNPSAPLKDLMVAAAAGLAAAAAGYAAAGSDKLTQMQVGAAQVVVGVAGGAAVAKMASPTAGYALIGGGVALGGKDLIEAGLQKSATPPADDGPEEVPDLDAVRVNMPNRRRPAQLGAVEAGIGRGRSVELNAVEFLDGLVA